MATVRSHSESSIALVWSAVFDRGLSLQQAWQLATVGPPWYGMWLSGVAGDQLWPERLFSISDFTTPSPSPAPPRHPVLTTRPPRDGTRAPVIHLPPASQSPLQLRLPLARRSIASSSIHQLRRVAGLVFRNPAISIPCNCSSRPLFTIHHPSFCWPSSITPFFSLLSSRVVGFR